MSRNVKISLVEKRGFPEFSDDDWRDVRDWMRDRRIPNIRAFYAYISKREVMYNAVTGALRRVR
jgi:hypothetical protein